MDYIVIINFVVFGMNIAVLWINLERYHFLQKTSREIIHQMGKVETMNEIMEATIKPAKRKK